MGYTPALITAAYYSSTGDLNTIQVVHCHHYHGNNCHAQTSCPKQKMAFNAIPMQGFKMQNRCTAKPPSDFHFEQSVKLTKAWAQDQYKVPQQLAALPQHGVLDYIPHVVSSTGWRMLFTEMRPWSVLLQSRLQRHPANIWTGYHTPLK